MKISGVTFFRLLSAKFRPKKALNSAEYEHILSHSSSSLEQNWFRKNLEAILLKKGGNSKAVFSDIEAAEFLKCSTKKLQQLRNAREIGFVRENGGRKILYKYEHLIEYLENHELKKKK